VNQESDHELQRVMQILEKWKSPGFVVHKDGTPGFHSRICVPKNEELRKQILKKAHNTRYSVHPGYPKMYRDMR